MHQENGTSDVRDVVVAGLRDAHALELQAKDMMESVSRLEGYAEFRSRAADHARETEVQIDRLRQCPEMAGASPSMLKGLGTRTVANLQGLMPSAVTDEVIKNALSGYAFEHLEQAPRRVRARTRRRAHGAAALGEPERRERLRELVDGGRSRP